MESERKIKMKKMMKLGAWLVLGVGSVLVAGGLMI